MPAASIDFPTLVDYALGKLPTALSARVSVELSRNARTLRDFEAVLQLIARLELQQQISTSDNEQCFPPHTQPGR